MRSGILLFLLAVGLGVLLAVPVYAPPTPINLPRPRPPGEPAIDVEGPCLPLDCTDVSVAAPPGFDYPDAADFVPDRRPAINVGIYAGYCQYPPVGVPSWWDELDDLDGNGIADCVDELVERFDEAYAQGWRRFIMTLPAGSYLGLMSSSQWWTMPPQKQQGLTLALPAWLDAHPDATLGAYVGFRIADPCLLCMQGCASCYEDCDAGGDPCALCPECTGVPVAQVPLTTSADDMCVMRQNLEPWIDAGLTEIWFDKAGGNNVAQWEAMHRLAGDPDYAGRIRFGAEPIVIEGNQFDMQVPVMDAVERLTHVSLRRYYVPRSRNAPPDMWVFDPATTEVHVMFRNDSFCFDQATDDGDPCTGCPDWCEQPDPSAIDVVYDYVQRGYIPHARGIIGAECIRRIFEMEVESLPCREDLDVDGRVDGDDADRVAMNMGMTSGATLYHGDVDLDGDVDVIDYFLLVSYPGFPGPCQ
jgi:hypothetical protein